MNPRGSYGAKGTHAAVAFALVGVKILLVPGVVILGETALTIAASADHGAKR